MLTPEIQKIEDAGIAKHAEFEEWAKKQYPPYYLKLNTWRWNEGSRWYSCERTQHTFEGFDGARKINDTRKT